MKNDKIKNVFLEGPISPDFIASSIAKHQSKTSIGAHDIFLGQVRGDDVDGRTVIGIEYTAYREMADPIFHAIRESAFDRFDLTCLHIYHSLGMVRTGEICLFVFVSSSHRKEAFRALEFLVEEIKAKAPVYGKEILDDASHQWKLNT